MNRDFWEVRKEERICDLRAEISHLKAQAEEVRRRTHPDEEIPDEDLAKLYDLDAQLLDAERLLRATEEETYEEALADARWDEAKARREDAE